MKRASGFELGLERDRGGRLNLSLGAPPDAHGRRAGDGRGQGRYSPTPAPPPAAFGQQEELRVQPLWNSALAQSKGTSITDRTALPDVRSRGQSRRCYGRRSYPRVEQC